MIALGAEHERRLETLHRALSWGPGFRLILAKVNEGPLREELQRRLRGWSGQGEVPRLIILDLKAEDPPFTALYRNSIVERAPFGVVLNGVDQFAPEGRASTALLEMNLHRDELPGLVPGPLVLIVSENTSSALLSEAPDFYSWRGYSISLSLAEASAASAIERLSLNPVTREHPADAVKRLKELLEGMQSRWAVGDRELAEVLRQLGEAESECAEYPAATGHLEEAFRLYRRAGDTGGEADTLLALETLNRIKLIRRS